jgi:prephenate dehydrogenase
MNDKKRITIIGTGLIGGSLGLALKASGLQGLEIVGYDRDRDVATKAEKAGALDRAENTLSHAVRGAGLVIIAVPVLSVREVMQQIAPDLEEGAVVTDTASTKAHVMQWAAEVLPAHVSFVGGHPMAGKETPGIEQAEGTLFHERAYCICPSVKASESAVKSVMGLASTVGADPMFIDAAEHDTYAAAVSHLPLMISTALFSMLRSSAAWPDLGMMASSAFRDVTRLAAGDPAMSHGIWTTNREAVIHWLERMAAELQRYRDMLTDAQDETLLETFARAQIEREIFIGQPPRRERPDTGVKVDSGQAMLSMLVGGRIAEQIKRARELPELMKQGDKNAPKGDKRRLSFGDRVAEGIKRDLDKLEQKRSGQERPEDESGGEKT